MQGVLESRVKLGTGVTIHTGYNIEVLNCGRQGVLKRSSLTISFIIRYADAVVMELSAVDAVGEEHAGLVVLELVYWAHKE